MHRRTWQKREAAAARLFGAIRKDGSGCRNRPDETRSDSSHPRLFIECKASKMNYAVRTLRDDAAKKAKKEGKIAVVALHSLRKKGFMLCVHSDDLQAFVLEYLALHPEIDTHDDDQQEISVRSEPAPTD